MNMKARTLLVALTGTWPKLSRIGAGKAGLKTPPPELRALAEKAHARDELLEHLSANMLYYNN
ncbi:hypothetical protein [Shimia sediminis]|uniref:hypothetical protein n=1 Tax=Shimia sediminis TaxID=2497945 RepID=UPI00197DF59D|nr:hypothetical protein [Shimia sediminis]